MQQCEYVQYILGVAESAITRYLSRQPQVARSDLERDSNTNRYLFF